MFVGGAELVALPPFADLDLHRRQHVGHQHLRCRAGVKPRERERGGSARG